MQGRSADPPCDPSQGGEGPGSALPPESYPGKGRVPGQGKKETLSPLLACCWSFSRHHFNFQRDGTTLAVLMDVVGVGPCGLQDMVACRRAVHMPAAN